MARKDRSVGEFQDPDLLPVMNMICILIPLMLWITTWATFGQITVERGSEGGASKGRMSEEQKKLRLVAVLTKGSITLMVSRDVSADILPEDAATGTKGRIDIPHRSVSLGDLRHEMQACRPPANPKDFNDCAYSDYLIKFVSVCWKNPSAAVKVPDLKALNLALRTVKDRVVQVFGDRLDDKDQISVKSEDDLPYCQLIGVMDFARMRTFDLIWEKDEQWSTTINEALAKGTVDPFLDPKVWNDAMKAELLFPIVGFVN